MRVFGGRLAASALSLPLFLLAVSGTAAAASSPSVPPTDGDGGPGITSYLTTPPPHVHTDGSVHTADEPDELPGGTVTVRYANPKALSARLAPQPQAATVGTADILSFNDFHGSLTGPTGNVSPGPGLATVPAGGLPQLYNALRTARAAHPDSITAGAGDLVGASPLNSAFFDDEPTLRGLSLAGLNVSSVGNHEFDEGQTELLRKQNGGCPNPADNQGCVFADPTRGGATTYQAPSFQYLAQNVRKSDNSTLLPGTKIITTANGIAVGFVGVTLRATPTVVTPSGVAGLTFTDEATEINNGAAALKSAGAQVVVALIHQGGNAGTTPNNCSAGGTTLTGDIAPIVANLSADVPVVISGHTHNGYVCSVPTSTGTKLVTQAKAFGQVLTDVSMTFDATGALTTATATNTIVGTTANTLSPGADATYDQLKSIVDAATAQAAPKANQVIGTISTDISGGSAGTPSGTTRCAVQECQSGDVIADAQLRATDPTRVPAAGGVIAFMNSGGIRNPYGFFVNAISSGGEAAGQVTYGEAFSVQPFGNSLTTKTLTGAQIKTLLETQFSGCLGQRASGDNFLQDSAGFSYTYDRSQPCGSKVSAASIKLNGVTLDPAAGYRVTENSFLASGGDNFVTFTQGTDPVGGGQDIDALAAYFAANPDLSAPARNRAVEVTASPALPEAPLAVLLVLGGGLAAAIVLGLRRRQLTAA